MERTRGCFRRLHTLFQEREECRAFELLNGAGRASLPAVRPPAQSKQPLSRPMQLPATEGLSVLDLPTCTCIAAIPCQALYASRRMQPACRSLISAATPHLTPPPPRIPPIRALPCLHPSPVTLLLPRSPPPDRRRGQVPGHAEQLHPAEPGALLLRKRTCGTCGAWWWP